MEIVSKYINDLFDIYDQLSKNSDDVYELEAIIDGPFVTRQTLKRIVSVLKCNKRTYTEKKLKNDRGNIIYRQRTFDDGSSILECKSRLFSNVAKELWTKLSLSSEIPFVKTFFDKETAERFSDVIEVRVCRYTAEHDGCIIEIGFNISTGGSWLEVERTKDSTREQFLNTIVDVISVLQEGKFISRFEYDDILRIVPKDYAKPVTLTKFNMKDITGCTFVSKKYDGVRAFLVFSLGKLYRVSIKNSVTYIRDTKENDTSVLDCEFINGKFYVMDVVMFRGENVMNQESKARLDYRKEFLDETILMKEFVQFVNTDQIIDVYKAPTDIPVDGVILLGSNYRRVIKWKPVNTVDMFVNNEKKLYAYGNIFVSSSTIDIPKKCKNVVCEFTYLVEEEAYRFVRIRDDKPNPNSIDIITQNINDGISTEELLGQECVLMRKYHNITKKSVLDQIGEMSEKTKIVDIGSGQLGDASKWKKFKRIYCIEPRKDDEYRRELEGRKIKRKNNISFLNYSMSEYPKYEDQIDDNVDIFTAFFCLNLFDKEDFVGLKALLTEKSGKKSVFSCICITSLKVESNVCYCVDILSDEFYNISLHGTRIQGLKERIVDKKLLIKFLEKCSFTLDESKVLQGDGYIMSKNERELSSMYELLTFKNF